jgi:hypothetical protein
VLDRIVPAQARAQALHHQTYTDSEALGTKKSETNNNEKKCAIGRICTETETAVKPEQNLP